MIGFSGWAERFPDNVIAEYKYRLIASGVTHR